MKSLSTFLSLLLTPLMAVLPLHAEMASIPGATTPSAQANVLQIRLAEPGRANVEANTFEKGFAIQVTDAAGMPVADVAVALRLPEEGATGFFVDGAHSAVAYTDGSGVAKFAQVNWGSTLGTVDIRVTAAKGELHAGALIEQTIVARSASTPQIQSPTLKVTPVPGTPASVADVHSGATPEQPLMHPAETAAAADPTVSIVNTAGSKGGHGSNKKWILLAAVAVGAGVGAALALSGKGASTGGAAAVGISIGAPTVSVGH